MVSTNNYAWRKGARVSLVTEEVLGQIRDLSRVRIGLLHLLLPTYFGLSHAE